MVEEKLSTEWTHARIRKELGFEAEESNNIRDILQQRDRGSRYSFGYPACPNIEDQFNQLDLLDTKRINMYMDESEQLYPEQSTKHDYYLSFCREIFYHLSNLRDCLF